MPECGKLYILIGPSGAGKDTLLQHLKKNHYSTSQPLVAHRYITRAVNGSDENHIELSESDFERRKSKGLFLFDWQSHDFQYAIGVEVKHWLEQGDSVIVNGSREYLPTALALCPGSIPVWLKVSEEILKQRLLDRGRETLEQIEIRIRRNQELEASIPDDCLTISNNQDVAITIEQLLLLIEITSQP